jgi:hypothetical protein
MAHKIALTSTASSCSKRSILSNPPKPSCFFFDTGGSQTRVSERVIEFQYAKFRLHASVVSGKISSWMELTRLLAEGR